MKMFQREVLIQALAIIADNGLNGTEITYANNDDNDTTVVPSVKMES